MKPLLLLALLSLPALAQQAPDSLSTLRENYARAIERANAPINATYAEELNKLMTKLTQAGDLEAALAVKKELEALKGTSSTTIPEILTATSAASAAPSSSKRLGHTEEKQIESRLVGRYWTYAATRADGYFFEKNGKGIRYMRVDEQAPIQWRILSDGRVQITGSGAAKWLTVTSEADGFLVNDDAAQKPMPFKVGTLPAQAGKP